MGTVPNIFPLRGHAATLQLASIDTPAGNLGQQIFNDEYNMATVGRATGVEIRITTDLEAFHEIGTRLPTDLLPGNINISGRVERAHINGALVRLLMGRLGGAGQNEDNFPLEIQPQFNMILILHDPRTGNETNGTRLTVSNVRFDDWVVTVPEDDFVMENVTFKALRIERAEVE
jgi:hypothetical protein